MFFRTKKSPSGQTLQLTEAYRNEQGLCRQRVVTSLGSVQISKDDQGLIAKAVEARLYNQTQLFEHEYPESVRQWIDRIVKKVDREGRWRKQVQIQEVQQKQSSSADTDNQTIVDGVILEEVCQADSVVLGPCLLGLQAWQQLWLPELLKELGFNPSQIDAAAVSTIGRLVFPGSEHQLLQWLPRTALPELLQTDLTCGAKDKFYRDRGRASHSSLHSDGSLPVSASAIKLQGDHIHRYKEGLHCVQSLSIVHPCTVVTIREK